MKKLSVSNWTVNEERYAEERRGLARRVDLLDYIDHPFVFCNRQKVTAALSRIELFKKVLNVKGSVVECGVHKGSSLMLFYHLSAILEPYALNRKIIGFDTFAGFRSLSAHDSAKLRETDFADTSYDTLVEMARMSELNRPLGHVAKLEIVKGDATKTIPEYVEQHPELIVALLYIDFDIYEPTKMAIQHLLPLVPRGGVVVFDELNTAKWVGETKAFKELLRLNEIRLEKFSFEPMSAYYVVE